MENGKNSNTVLLTVLGVATLLVALVGATFAYFSATVSNEDAQSVSITTATPVALIYKHQNGALTMTNSVPGSSKTATFLVRNPDGTDEDLDTAGASTVAQQYDLHLWIDANTFTTEKGQNDVEEGNRTEQLLVKVTATSSVTDKTVAVPTLKTVSNETVVGTNVQYTYDVTSTPATNVAEGKAPLAVVTGQTIAIGENHTYTVELIFNDLTISQNANIGQNFMAHFEVSNVKSVN